MTSDGTPPPAVPRVSAGLLLGIGIAAQTAQILLLRELMALSYGTEVAAALLLGAWMAGGALGSAAARKAGPVVFAAALALAIIPALCLARLGRPLTAVGLGEAVTLSRLALVTLATSLPISALGGALFASAARRYPDPGRAYAIEAAGAGIAGLALVLLLPAVNPFVLAIVAGALPLALAFRRIARAATAVLAILAALLLPGLDRLGREAYWRSFGGEGFRLREHRDSPYGPLAMVEYRGQFNVYHSGRLQFSLPEHGELAPPIHLALLLHPSPKRVLLVGGGIAGGLRAALRHPVERIDYVELDAAVVDLAKPYAGNTGLGDPRVSFQVGDGLSFVRDAAPATYDVLIILAGEPSVLASNRCYTLDFFRDARRILKNDGAILVGPFASHTTYADDRHLARNGMLYTTIREVFPEAKATAGGAGFFVASPHLLADRGIDDVDFLSMIDPFAAEKVRIELLAGKPYDPLFDEYPPAASFHVNTASRPLAVLRSTALEAAMVRDPAAGILDLAERALPFAVAIVLAALGIVPLARPRAAPATAVLAAGLFGSGSLLLILAAYQSSFGALYLGAAAMFGLFMAGVAGGAAAGTRVPLPLSLAAGAAVCALTVALFRVPFLPLHGAAALLAGACLGAAFPAALRRAGADSVGRLYALDLAGGMAGALVIAPLALPLWGAWVVAAVLAAACLLPLPGLLRHG